MLNHIMEKRKSEMLVELLETHNCANDYKWRIEVENLGDNNGDDFYVFVYPYMMTLYSTELRDLTCLGSSFHVSYWCEMRPDNEDKEFKVKPVFAFS